MRGVGNSINTSANISENCTINRCEVGDQTRICEYVNMYDCVVGDRCMIGAFVEIQASVEIGNDTRIQSHTFVCSDVTIGNNCFISHNVSFINDDFKNMKVNFDSDFWKMTTIRDNVIIGTSATIFPVDIGKGAIIGAGSVVTKDIGENEIWYGNPAKFIKMKS